MDALVLMQSVAFAAAELFGVSFALGAFFAGMTLSEYINLLRLSYAQALLISDGRAAWVR